MSKAYFLAVERCEDGGKIILPPEVIAVTGKKIVALFWREHTCRFYSESEWTDFLQSVRDWPYERMKVLRLLLSNQREITVKEDGAVVIPDRFLQYAQITDRVKLMVTDEQKCIIAADL